MMHLTHSMIEKVPFFKGADEGFVRSLVDRLRPRVAAEAELMCTPGEMGDEMFFVHRGELDVLVGSDAIKVATLRQDDYFGEGLLINRPRTSAVRTATFCDLFTLTRAALEEVLPYYPQTTDALRALVNDRLELDRRKGREAELSNKFGRRFLRLGAARRATAGTSSRGAPQSLRANILARALKRGNS
jgi:CRP-like cAMP-binding protein